MQKGFKSLVLFLKYKFKVNQMFFDVPTSSCYKSKVASLTGVYRNLKIVADQIGNSKCRENTYNDLIKDLLIFEEKFSSCYVMKSSAQFKYDDERFMNLTSRDLNCDEIILDYVVWLVRKDLFDRLKPYYPRVRKFDDLNLVNECYHAAHLTAGIFRELGIGAEAIKIPAGFSDEIKLYDGSGYHWFTIVKLGKGEYLVDCTYRQFFRLDRNLIERLGVMGVAGCDPGVFMKQTEERMNVASEILKRGWISATPQNMKHYFDGFALANRNGLYYEKNGLDYSTDYSYDDYVSFLKTTDSQIEREGIVCLGTQKKVLSNPAFKFKLK